MSDTQVHTGAANGAVAAAGVPMRIEVVVLPVADVDRSLAFYSGLGWRLDGDFPGDDGSRVVQMTPPGSSTSIIFGSGVVDTPPGSVQSLLLVVDDMEAARAELAANGVDVGEPFHDAGGGLGGGWTGDPAKIATGPDPEGRSYATYARFSDPDGNGWLLQEITDRLPGRV